MARAAGLVGRVAAWGLVLAAAAAQADSRPAALSVAPSHGPTVAIRGDIAGLAPGAPGVLRVTLTNRSDRPASLQEVSVGVTPPAGVSECHARDLRVTAHHGALVVPAHGRKRVDLAIRFSPELPDVCAGQPWGLHYSAR